MTNRIYLPVLENGNNFERFKEELLVCHLEESLN
jgi:hypothetical protein